MRRITSLVLLATFLVVTVTGIHMVVGHHNRQAGPGAGPRATAAAEGSGGAAAPVVAVRPKGGFYPKELHEWAAFVMVAAGIVHVILNFKVMMCHLGLAKSRQGCDAH